MDEGDVSLMLDLLDALADGKHGPGRFIEQYCKDRGIPLAEVEAAHDRLCEKIGTDSFWSEVAE